MLVGKKIGMSQVFNDKGERIPVTLVAAELCQVTQIRTPEKDGYLAIQVGYDEKKKHQIHRAQQKVCERAGLPYFKRYTEFRLPTNGSQEEAQKGFQLGDVLTVEQFKPGDRVEVTGTSKGKGFAGVMKRHHFAGGPASHGSMFHRAPGSIGMCTFPGRVLKGMKMPGHMGNRRTTVKRIQVVQVDPKKKLLVLKGAIPGSRNSWVVIRPSSG